ncbi:hypothetical protein F889_02508 [Acinetobacter colistiniresistens]|uniref:DUF3021 domain-containing protein n=1 Tax=Acinetobacter colistiniresistens TaxID=280145 RepID=N9PJU2_9GAMM|nr:hypothetical protein [Acinetobacter colistiniresistens]ENX33844.1 hypothetical protein F889_02508 [Acinetobacter colistiniresistens]
MNYKYYLRNLIGSFIGFCILAGVVKTIFQWTTNQYEILGTIFGFIVMVIGTIAIGYLNTASAPDIKLKKSLIIHTGLIIFMFSTDLMFGSSDFIVDVLRNIGLFAALQFGVFIYQVRCSKALLLN